MDGKRASPSFHPSPAASLFDVHQRKHETNGLQASSSLLLPPSPIITIILSINKVMRWPAMCAAEAKAKATGSTLVSTLLAGGRNESKQIIYSLYAWKLLHMVHIYSRTLLWKIRLCIVQYIHCRSCSHAKKLIEQYSNQKSQPGHIYLQIKMCSKWEQSDFI